MSLRMSDVRDLAQGLNDLVRWLRRSTPSTVSLSTLSALSRLGTEGPLRVTELAEREAMTQPGVTMLVNRLAENGWAERVPDPTDRRATLVRITDAGVALIDERYAHRARILRERLVRLSDADQRAIADALPAIRRLVATENTENTQRNDTPDNTVEVSS